MPKVGRRRKKTRTHVVDNETAQSALVSAEALKVPKSLVIRRGKVESEVVELVEDLRKLMLPYTALHFQEDAKNTKLTLSHYAKELAIPMGVSHILALTQNSERLNLRIARVPEGPTMTFRVKQFSLAKHVKAIQRRPYNSPGAHQHPPVVVTNNFGDATAAPHIKLMRITFQNMFPAINVATVKLVDCRRVVLFHLVHPPPSTDDSGEAPQPTVEVRHYAVKATPVGINKKVRRLIQTKLPNLNKLDDIADYITGETMSGQPAPSATSGNVSDSEPEDETSHVVLPQTYSGRGNVKHQKSALKLVELGPRLNLQLLKVERGLGGGDVMYHSYITKSVQEVQKLKEKKQKEAELKQKRREEQDRNVERKRKEKEDKRETKRQRMEEREKDSMEDLRRRGGQEDDEVDDDEENSDDEPGTREADNQDSSDQDDDED